jgi:hypothetical protein
MGTTSGYDIIGDIHGYAEELKELLTKLGYELRYGCWSHSERQAIFLGDFIDRGPKQVETYRIARNMVDSGAALAVMGNHEFNAIAWFLPNPCNPEDSLRTQFGERGKHNRHQHAAFLAEVEHDRRLHEEIIDWFLTLPLWLDLPQLRVVHACWHDRFMRYLAPKLLPGERLSKHLMRKVTQEPANAAEKDSPAPSAFKAAEALTKGVEMPLPPGFSFTDKDGKVRDRVRVRWWDTTATTYRAAALPEDGLGQLPEDPIPPSARIGYDGEKPVFFGHYWLTGRPTLQSSKVACLDFSIAKGGSLCAYRWNGEQTLTPDGLEWVQSRKRD